MCVCSDVCACACACVCVCVCVCACVCVCVFVCMSGLLDLNYLRSLFVFAYVMCIEQRLNCACLKCVHALELPACASTNHLASILNSHIFPGHCHQRLIKEQRRFSFLQCRTAVY